MAKQAYPDLMTPWELTIVPIHGLPGGNGLFLHRGGRHPEVAFALGFRPSPLGFVFEPGEPDPDFGISISRVAEAISAILPGTRFVSVDPVALAMEGGLLAVADEGGRRAGIAARRHRSAIRQTLAGAPEASAPRVRWIEGDLERHRSLLGRDHRRRVDDVPDVTRPGYPAALSKRLQAFAAPVGFYVSVASNADTAGMRSGRDRADARRLRHAGEGSTEISGRSRTAGICAKHAVGTEIRAPARFPERIDVDPPSFAVLDALIASEEDERAGNEGCTLEDPDGPYRPV